MTVPADIFELRFPNSQIQYFGISRERKILPVLAAGGSSLAQSGGDISGASGVIPLQSPEFNQALESAFDGHPSTFRFTAFSAWRQALFELHLIPAGAGNGDRITAVLIDRSDEIEVAAGLRARISTLDLISQVVKAFSETRNLTDVLRIILLGVSAGSGLGFNRGFILLANETRSHLWGCLATGPSTSEEAGAIWQDMAQRDLNLEQILRLYRSNPARDNDIHVNRLVASLKIPLSDATNFIVRAVNDGHSIITVPEMMDSPGSRELIAKFGTDSIAVVPLFSRENLQGVLLADNLITQKPICTADIDVLEIFARYAADAIENSRLYGKLEQQICRLKEANEKIVQSRENLIKAEKLSSVAKIALDVAHEIRNPLTIIGGYANSHIRKLTADDPSFKILEVICRQSARIEHALDRFSSVVQLSERKEGRFSLPDLIRETINMLCAGGNCEYPSLLIEPGVEWDMVFVDQGLFHQALIAIMRKASQLASDISDLRVRLARDGHRGIIFIDGPDNWPKFAEQFYSMLRDSRGDLKNQDMAVALEILQHYGGGIGMAPDISNVMRVYMELPLCREEA